MITTPARISPDDEMDLNPFAEPPQIEDGVLKIVLDAHRREGYAAGYRRAIADLLAAGVFLAERALAESDASDGARRAVYRFVESIEATAIRQQQHVEVSDGLGI